jgi:2'-hydroxyisoflavone reductase
MRLLILGGTAFVGRHLVDAALARGHQVTLFNRGITAPAAIAGVEQLHGDREAPGGLAALAGRTWDAVLDTSGYLPRAVRAVAEALPDVAHYGFVSSVSVYADFSRLPLDESSGVHEPPADPEALGLATYGGLKVACERALDAALPGRVQHVRAGLVLGPLDYDDRFAWLLERVAAGGEVLAGGEPSRPAQLIDVRDLASFLVRSAESHTTGVHNAIGPAEPLPLVTLLETIRAVVGGDARFTWVDDTFLIEHQVGAYSELPFWLPAFEAGPITAANARARAAGLTFRPLIETVADTWRWLREHGAEREAARATRRLAIPAGLPRERERQLLTEWAARASGRT